MLPTSEQPYTVYKSQNITQGTCLHVRHDHRLVLLPYVSEKQNAENRKDARRMNALAYDKGALSAPSVR